MTHADDNLSHHGVDDPSGGGYPNETIRLLIERSSCRSFFDRKIPDTVMNLIIESGCRAATGGNLQPYSIIKIENPATKKKLAELCGDQPFIETAPVDLIFCLDFHRLKRWAELEWAPFSATKSFRHFWISFQDTIIAAQNICTAADALGLGSVYVGTVLECLRELKRLLQLPDGVFPVVLLALGYPKVRPSSKKKLGIDTIVHNETYQDLPDNELHAAFTDKYPDWKKEITDERLETIAQVCREVHGQEFADKCLTSIKKNGYINVVQNYFGLHYRADLMPHHNSDFLQIMREYGFEWLERE